MTPQTLEHSIYGESPEPVDRLLEIRTRLTRIHLSPEAGSQNAFETERVRQLAQVAGMGFDALIARAADRPNSFHQEMKRIRRCLEEACALGTGRKSPTLHAFSDEIQRWCADLEFERHQVIQEAAKDLEVAGGDLRDRMVDLGKILEQAAGQPPPERGSRFVTVRKTLVEFSVVADGKMSAANWLRLGWVEWSLMGSPDDAVARLEQAVKAGISQKSPASILAGRLLAHLYELQQDYESAYRAILRSIEADNSALSHFDAARIALGLDRRNVARRHIEIALTEVPLLLIPTLASNIAMELGVELLDFVHKLQLRLRQDAKQAAVHWAASSRRVSESRRIGGIEGAVSSLLLDGHREAIALAEEADLFVARGVISDCRKTIELLMREARDAIATEHSKRSEVVAQHKKALQDAWDRREAAVIAARAKQQQAIDEASAALQISSTEGDKAQRGCAFGMSAGCGFGVLYIIAATILMFRGVDIGIMSPVGLLAVTLAGTPAAIAFIKHLVFVMKRMALDQQLNQSIGAATVVYEQAVREADARFKEVSSEHRDALATAEKSLRGTSDAMKVLHATG